MNDSECIKDISQRSISGGGGGGEEKWECCGENFGENCMFIQVIMMLCVHFHCQKH